MMLKRNLLKFGYYFLLSHLMITSLHAMDDDESYTLNHGRYFGTEMELDEENLAAVNWFLNLDPKIMNSWQDEEKMMSDAGGSNDSTKELTPDEISFVNSLLSSDLVDSSKKENKGTVPSAAVDEVLAQGTIPASTVIPSYVNAMTWPSMASSSCTSLAHPTRFLQDMPIKMEPSSVEYGASVFPNPYVSFSAPFTNISEDLFEKEELEDEFTISTGGAFKITGPESVILRKECTSFERFKAFYGRFSQTNSIEQMKLEIAWHLLNVSALKALNSYGITYRAGACSVQCRSGSTYHLGGLVYEKVRMIRGTWDQLLPCQIVKLHESMKEQLTGAKIIFEKG